MRHEATACSAPAGSPGRHDVLATLGLEQSPDGVLLSRPDGAIVAANDAACRLLGHPCEALVGRDIRSVRLALEEGGFQRAWEVLRTGGHVRNEVSYRRADGSTLFAEVSISRFLSGGDELACALLRDVGSRRRTEEALRQSEIRHRGLLAALPDAIYVIDTNGVFVDAHMPDIELHQISAEELIGLEMSAYLPEDANTSALAILRQVAETGVARIEEISLPLNDELMHFEARLGPAGPGLVVAVVRDITARRKAEGEAREQADRNRAIVEAIPDRIIVLDRNAIVVDMHSPGVSHERARAAAVGLRMQDFMPSPVAARIGEIVTEVLATGAVARLPVPLRNADGASLLIDGSFARMDDKRVLVVARDVTDRVRADESNRASEARFLQLLSSVNDIVFEVNDELVTTAVFGNLLKAMGVPSEMFVGQPVGTGMPPDIARLHVDVHRRALAGDTVRYEWSLATPDGQPRHYQTVLAPIRAAHGGVTGLVGVGRDITELVRGERALRRQTDLYESLLDAQAEMGDAMLLCEGETPAEWLANVVYRNAALGRLTGYSEAELDGIPSLFELVPEAERGALAERLVAAGARVGKPLRVEFAMIAKKGRRLRIEGTFKPFRNTERGGLVVLLRDVTERAQMLAELEHRAFFDGLTELPNRNLFLDRLRGAIATSRRSAAPVSVLLMDLDRFKEVNDTFGHIAGDGLLRQIAERIRGLLRDTDTTSRLGGDEFAFVLPGADAREAEATGHRLLRALESPFTIEGRVVDVGASVGVAVCPHHGDDSEALLRRADIAMYAAKRAGLGVGVYEPSADRTSPARLSMGAELRAAIENGELRLHFQPQVSVKTGVVTGMEALVRWQHPRNGLVAPDEFIPLAEQTGLIRPLTRWVVEEALRTTRAFHDAGFPLKVAVNLSMRNLSDPQIAKIVETALSNAGVAPHHLELELTESAIMEDAASALTVLNGLRAIGVRLTVDDFGTGYSSLAYLHRLPLGALKIDKSFVMNTTDEPSSSAIMRSTIDLAHSLGLEVVAEGVEHANTFARLRAAGCDEAQGYFISRPLTAADLLAKLRDEALTVGSILQISLKT